MQICMHINELVFTLKCLFVKRTGNVTMYKAVLTVRVASALGQLRLLSKEEQHNVYPLLRFLFFC